MKITKKPKVVNIPILRAFASIPSLANLHWIFKAFIETLEENERLREKLREIQGPRT